MEIFFYRPKVGRQFPHFTDKTVTDFFNGVSTRYHQKFTLIQGLALILVFFETLHF